MHRNIKITIITPCYNSDKTIEKTLNCIKNLKYENFEYIIVDGGSTDNTMEIVNKYKPFFQSKLLVISEPDEGIYDAMNKGIRLATGEIVGIVNSDDFYEDDCLNKVIQAYDRNNGDYQIIYGGMRCIDVNGSIVSEVFYHHKYLEGQMINHPATFITKKLYDDFGCYDTKYRSAADYDFLLTMKKNQKVVFIPIYKILTNFMTGGMSSTYTGTKETFIVQYKHELISKKIYVLNRVKIFIKKMLRA